MIERRAAKKQAQSSQDSSNPDAPKKVSKYAALKAKLFDMIPKYAELEKKDNWWDNLYNNGYWMMFV